MRWRPDEALPPGGGTPRPRFPDGHAPGRTVAFSDFSARPSLLSSRLAALRSSPKGSLLGSRLSTLLSQSQGFPLTRSPAFAYKCLARLESEMASPAKNPKAICGEASRHTCKASSVYNDLDRPKFFVPTGHHARERWPHAAHHLRSCFRTNVSNTDKRLSVKRHRNGYG